MPEISVPWGDGEMSLALPEHWQIQQVAQSSLPAATEDWPERLAMALAQPSAGDPLSKLLPSPQGSAYTTCATQPLPCS